jgi:hypothetical protein
MSIFHLTCHDVLVFDLVHLDTPETQGALRGGELATTHWRQPYRPCQPALGRIMIFRALAVELLLQKLLLGGPGLPCSREDCRV